MAEEIQEVVVVEVVVLQEEAEYQGEVEDAELTNKTEFLRRRYEKKKSVIVTIFVMTSLC